MYSIPLTGETMSAKFGFQAQVCTGQVGEGFGLGQPAGERDEVGDAERVGLPQCFGAGLAVTNEREVAVAAATLVHEFGHRAQCQSDLVLWTHHPEPAAQIPTTIFQLLSWGGVLTHTGQDRPIADDADRAGGQAAAQICRRLERPVHGDHVVSRTVTDPFQAAQDAVGRVSATVAQFVQLGVRSRWSSTNRVPNRRNGAAKMK